MDKFFFFAALNMLVNVFQNTYAILSLAANAVPK